MDARSRLGAVWSVAAACGGRSKMGRDLGGGCSDLEFPGGFSGGVWIVISLSAGVVSTVEKSSDPPLPLDLSFVLDWSCVQTCSSRKTVVEVVKGSLIFGEEEAF
ncbi:unnamed protein product [Cuscuta campestris]|uniref:Uncharacterized protein n=1 Tax=Cuscuta campestris TaxID=132261 RepID=A0A484KJI3_9ASTE|nr:unnamed protein product [Cuscuta campestris]